MKRYKLHSALYGMSDSTDLKYLDMQTQLTFGRDHWILSILESHSNKVNLSLTIYEHYFRYDVTQLS